MLHHPLIIEYYTSFIEDETLSIVMEYAAGGTLGAFLRGRNKALEEEDVLNLFCQILLGLEHVHSKDIVHRDLTTDNIFLTKNYKMIKIGDFGISKILASKSKANTVVGTPCYMSPELCQGRPYNNKSDIWALGCVLYEMLTLKRAFEAPTLPNLVLKIMEGAFQPIEHHIYDVEIYKLMNLMLHLKPEFRPSVSKIRVHPIILQPLYSLFVNLGNIT
ncbi:Eukaryotic translation initiation factor 2-alpha kinase [Gryllus bimaculatus]|nr:Eukaryotic translation initiation factor 2-alpha kinase [Gryllus bimaculatus]